MNQLDAEWSKEYSEMDDFYAVVDTLVSGLELATSQGGSVYQLAFDEKAYHDSELYKVQTKLNDYATSYVDYNKQQEEVYELEKSKKKKQTSRGTKNVGRGFYLYRRGQRIL